MPEGEVAIYFRNNVKHLHYGGARFVNGIDVGELFVFTVEHLNNVEEDFPLVILRLAIVAGVHAAYVDEDVEVAFLNL